MSDNSRLAEKIKTEALNAGYDKCGLIKLEALTAYGEQLNRRMEIFPEDRPFLETFRNRTELGKQYPWAKSIVVCASYSYLGKYFNGRVYIIDLE